MFAVLGRLSPSYEEAAYDLGASSWQAVRHVVIPIVFPGMIAVALFGFTLSYDEFPRSWLTVGSKNTLPLEIWTMTTNVTSPALYALGTVTTVDLLHRDRARARLDRLSSSASGRGRDLTHARRPHPIDAGPRDSGSGEIRLVDLTKTFGRRRR